MANPAPNVSVNISAASFSPATNATTGTWFTVGTAHGPSGIAIKVNSLSDFVNYYGTFVNGQLVGRYNVADVDSSLLYDALDVFFREGGITAYVSRLIASDAVKAATAASKFTLTATGGGQWANTDGPQGLNFQVNAVMGQNSTLVYTAKIYYNNNIIVTSPALYNDLDVVNWINSIGPNVALCSAVYNPEGTSVLPDSASGPGSAISIPFTGGTEGTAPVDSDAGEALEVYTEAFGPGQVSMPGHVSADAYGYLTEHAQMFNRVAFLDGQNGNFVDNSSYIIADVVGLQGFGLDTSYSGVFAPWLVVPGLTSGNAGGQAVFSRTVAPSALAAARCAANDTLNDCNVPAAGVGAGSSSYAINITVDYSADARAALNNAGINVIRKVANANAIAIYGFRSAATDPNWIFLNNVRFRMQMVRDLDRIGEQFIFAEIDGKGQIFGAFSGVIAGLMQTYWLKKSIYGMNPSDAYQINTGPQVNTPATIAAGQINANVNVKMSPFGEFVTINVTKYASNAVFPR